MNTNTAAYWIALGVLALGLNSEYQHGHFATLHQAAGRAGSVICQISSRAEQTLAVATGLVVRRAAPEDVLATLQEPELARAQAEMIREEARAQAESVREQVRNEMRAQRDVLRAQADLRRAQMDQLRARTLSDMHLARVVKGRVVVCPKTGVRVTLDDGSQGDGFANVEVSETY